MAQDWLTEKQRFWLDHIESCLSSGVSMRAYADRHGLDVQRFYGWKNQLKRFGVLSENSNKVGSAQSSAARVETCPADQRSASFIRASIIPAEVAQPSEPKAPNRSSAARIILANGITIDVPDGADWQALGALIVAAQQVPTSKEACPS